MSNSVVMKWNRIEDKIPSESGEYLCALVDGRGLVIIKICFWRSQPYGSFSFCGSELSTTINSGWWPALWMELPEVEFSIEFPDSIKLYAEGKTPFDLIAKETENE